MVYLHFFFSTEGLSKEGARALLSKFSTIEDIAHLGRDYCLTFPSVYRDYGDSFGCLGVGMRVLGFKYSIEGLWSDSICAEEDVIFKDKNNIFYYMEQKQE